jgi:hypothetical protein
MLTESEVLAALPSHGFLRAYVEYAAGRTDANLAYHLAGGLMLLSQAVPIDYAMPWGSPVYGNVYGMVVGGSSKSRKTSALNIAARLLQEALPSSLQETPGSTEGLIESLRREPKQVVLYPEFGEFLAKAEEGYFLTMKTLLTSLWDAMPVGRALASGSKGQIQKPRLSVTAAVATDLLERHTEEADWTGGFVARFLTFYAEPERHFTTPPMDDIQTKHSLAEWLRGLADFTVPMQDGDAASPPGICKGMTPEAQRLWTAWAEEEAKKTKGANTRVAASIARATSHAGKVAILLSWDIGRARSGETWHIGEAEVSSALAITSLHIKSVLELGDRVTGSRDMRDRRAVLNAVSTSSPTPLGVIIKRASLLKRRVVEVLDSLVEEQAVLPVSVGRGGLAYLQTPEMQKALLASDGAVSTGATVTLNIPKTVERHPAPVLTHITPTVVAWERPADWVEGEDSVIYMEDDAP